MKQVFALVEKMWQKLALLRLKEFLVDINNWF